MSLRRDELDELLSRAGQPCQVNAVVTDEMTLKILSELVHEGSFDARVPVPSSEGSTGSRGSKAFPIAAALGVATLLLGGGAVAASEWGPWNYVTEPDWVLKREWYDASGDWIGTCESHVALEEYPAEMSGSLQEFLTTLDAGSLPPDPQWVAIGLQRAGRIAELPLLVPASQLQNIDVSDVPPNSFDPLEMTYMSNARILHMALEMNVFKELETHLLASGQYPVDKDFREDDFIPLMTNTQIQCSTDPEWLRQANE